MLWNLTAEARKHRAYREVWVGLALGLGFLALQTLLYGDSMPMWYTVQQDIWSFGGIVAAFTVCVTLPRVFCCEEEQHTSPLLRTAAQGPLLTWFGKVLYLVLVCGALSMAIGVISLGAAGMRMGWEGALEPVSGSRWCADGDLPPMNNLAFCILQYVLLWGGCVYFALFLSILALLTGRTALTVVLSGLSYGIPLFCLLNPRLVPKPFRGPVSDFLRFWFTGCLQGSCWFGDENVQGGYGWSHLPLSLAAWAGIVGVEAVVLWLLWKRRAKR